MRPIYEKPADRANQLAVIKILEGKYAGVKFEETEMLCPVDFQVKRDGKLSSIVEIKCRSYDSAAFKDYLISSHKIRQAAAMAKHQGIKFILVVKWLDRIVRIEITDDTLSQSRLGSGGRTDRNDSQDTEECYYIPLSLFETVHVY